MPGARCTRGLVCKMHKKMRTRAYRFSGNTPTFPAQWFYGLCRALPGERIRLVTVAAGLTAETIRLNRIRHRQLDTSNGCRNHTLLPYAAARLRQPPSSETGRRREKKLNRAWRRSSCAPCIAHGKPPCDHLRADAAASTASRPTFVTMANAPLLGRDGRSCKSDLPDMASEIFLNLGIDTISEKQK